MSARRTPKFRKSIVVPLTKTPKSSVSPFATSLSTTPFATPKSTTPFATSKSTTPFATPKSTPAFAKRNTPSNFSSAKSSGSNNIKGWDFDFSHSPLKPSTSRQNVANKSVAKDDDSNDIPPTQEIEIESDEDGSSSAGTSPILTVSEPAFKRFRLATDDNAANSDDSSSSVELQATSAVRTINFDTPNVVEKVRTKISEFKVIKRSIFERFSTNRDGEAEIVESFDSQTSEENGECSKNVENLSDKTSTLFTGAMWLKQIENKDKLGMRSTNSPCDIGQIMSAVSSSSSSPASVERPEYFNTPFEKVKPTKRKRRPNFWLGRKLETVMKNRDSDRVLQKHISNSKTFGNPAQAPLKGRIVAIEDINQTKSYVKCLQVKSESDIIFKFIYHNYKDDRVKLRTGSDVTIFSPWSSFTSTSGQEIVTSFCKIEISGDDEPEDPICASNILLLSDCSCHDRKSESEELVSDISVGEIS